MWFAQWFYESSHGIHGTYDVFLKKPTETQFGCMCIPGTLRTLELPVELEHATDIEAKSYFDAGSTAAGFNVVPYATNTERYKIEDERDW